MRLIKDHRGIRGDMLRTALGAGDKTLCVIADCIGIVVAEFRMNICPIIRKSVEVASSLGRQISKKATLANFTLPTGNSTKSSLAQQDRKIVVTLPVTHVKAEKKYTYEWAVSRIEELERIGVSDPVSYFNNEMADWWLAPEGMMEEEADFVGIARAIEERWHN